MAKYLVSQGADVNRGRERGRETPLHVAAEKGLAELIEALLANGADIEAKTSGDVTPLMTALKSGHAEAARLIARRCAPGSVHRAIVLGETGVVRVLVEKDTKPVNAEYGRGMTPLNIALLAGIRSQYRAFQHMVMSIGIAGMIEKSESQRFSAVDHVGNIFASAMRYLLCASRHDACIKPLHVQTNTGP